MQTKYPHIFSPITIGGKTFKNRIWTAPAGVHLLSGEEPYPNEAVIAYYAEKARGGSAAVCAAGHVVSNHDARQRAVHDRFDICNPRYQRFWCQLTDSVHHFGAKASIELLFFGLGAKGKNGDPMQFSVNAPPPEMRQREKRIEIEDMEVLAHSAADAAEAALCCGYDILLLHFAHGFIVSQFLSARINCRDDEFGPQSVENRCRLADMIINAIRRRVGDKILLEVRLSASEQAEGGYDVYGCRNIIRHFQDRIDIAHLSPIGIAGKGGPPLGAAVEEKLGGEGFNAKYGAAIKADPEIRIPILNHGGFMNAAAIEKTLAEGNADLVAMARGTICDPERVNKFLFGRADEAIPCIRCGWCGNYENATMFGCSTNPRVGREMRMPLLVAGSGAKKKVAVVGGGPAGMQAAFTAAEQGHDVHLFEKSGALGGLMKYADFMPIKRELKEFLDYQRTMVARRGVHVRLSTEATPEMLAEMGPDAIIAAVGGRTAIPPIPGTDRENALDVHECYRRLAAGTFRGDSVAVVGGGLVGCEIALHLAMELKKKVTIIEMLGRVANEDDGIGGMIVRDMLSRSADCRTGARCRLIGDGFVACEDADGAAITVLADTVVLSTGMRAEAGAAERFCGIAREFAAVGDCAAAANVRGAVLSGWRAALAL
jgi:2,4-dienoyl-CoA reductase-like NADH-dependent reductase (Old Yellow Enzyme family)